MGGDLYDRPHAMVGGHWPFVLSHFQYSGTGGVFKPKLIE